SPTIVGVKNQPSINMGIVCETALSTACGAPCSANTLYRQKEATIRCRERPALSPEYSARLTRRTRNRFAAHCPTSCPKTKPVPSPGNEEPLTWTPATPPARITLDTAKLGNFPERVDQ